MRFVCPAGRKDRESLVIKITHTITMYIDVPVLVFLFAERAMFSCSRLNVKFVLYIFNMFIIGVFEERLWRNNLCT